MRQSFLAAFLAAVCLLPACVTMGAASPVASMNLVTTSGLGASVGKINFSVAANSVILHVHVHGLPPGDHGMHMHANGVCTPGPNVAGEIVAAGGAGGHYDPMQTGHHEGPNGVGHLGDLPSLHVDANGSADGVLVAPRLHDISALRGRAIVIHANGDTYSDTPAPLGGGGARIACGVIG